MPDWIMLHWMAAEVAPGLNLRLVGSAMGLRAIDFDFARSCAAKRGASEPVLAETARQLREYFAGKLRDFSLPLDLQGTDFQLRVWNKLVEIPYGVIRSYAEIAVSIGAPKAVRAVGAANGANPIPIVVPCHRVIGSSGKLIGYGGGLPLKKRLLQLEANHTGLFQP